MFRLILFVSLSAGNPLKLEMGLHEAVCGGSSEDVDIWTVLEDKCVVHMVHPNSIQSSASAASYLLIRNPSA